MGRRRRMLASDIQQLLILTKPQVIKGVFNIVGSRKVNYGKENISLIPGAFRVKKEVWTQMTPINRKAAEEADSWCEFMVIQCVSHL